MSLVILTLAYALVPALAIYGVAKSRILRAVNPVIICYVVGIIAGNVGILPEGAAGLQDALSTGVVAVSIPLLLFSVNVRSWSRTSARALIAMGLAAVAVAVSASVGHLIFGSRVPQSARIAGMMVGLYTGGTPNLAAIATALHVNTESYLAVHATDTVVSGLYLLFVITAAKPLFAKFMRPFELKPIVIPGSGAEAAGGFLPGSGAEAAPAETHDGAPRAETSSNEAASGYASSDGGSDRLGVDLRYTDVFRRQHIGKSALALGAAIVVVGVSLGISQLFPSEWETIVVLFGLTSLALAASLIPAVNRIPTSFKMAEYLVLVFCLVVGSMANIEQLLQTPIELLAFVAFTLIGSFVLHLLLCWIARIDVDTMLVTSTAAVCSPPFVGMVGVAIGNRTIISAGIVVGIIGYAVGNYIGVIIALVLERLA